MLGPMMETLLKIRPPPDSSRSVHAGRSFGNTVLRGLECPNYFLQVSQKEQIIFWKMENKLQDSYLRCVEFHKTTNEKNQSVFNLYEKTEQTQLPL